MPDFLTILVGGLAIWRAANMIAKEDGPAHVFYRIRQFVENKFGLESSLTKGVNCPLCVSFWFSWIAAWPVSSSNYNYIMSALAMAAVVMFFTKFFR